MATSPVINALRRKRAELAGLIRELDARIHDLRRDQGHIDATLKLFDPDAQPRTIKPVRPYRPRNRLFEKKELSVRVMTALSEAGDGGTTIDAIAERIMTEKGLEAPAARMIRGVIAIALKGLKRRSVAMVNSETSPRWSVTR
jgi:hypothetical protein